MPIQSGGTFQPNPRIASPGVFTREFDQSGVAQGQPDIGAAIVAPFAKGPGFSPTLVTSVADLESKFGVADGVYYGPYTAKEYLTERGLVTVCRVGGLTGYHQKYPYVIYAVKGTYGRNNDVGSFGNSTDSYLSPSSSAWSLGNADVTYVSGSDLATDTAGTITFTSASLTLTFDAAAVTANPILANTLASGSQTYNNQSVVLKFVGEQLTFTGGSGGNTLSVTSGYGANAFSYTNAQDIWAAMVSGSVTGLVIGPLALNASQADSAFNGASLISASIQAVTGACATPIFTVVGMISGAFGTYNGAFSPVGTVTYNPCNNIWTASAGADVKVLAVLADTQNNPIDSNLEASGFSGSLLMSGSSWVGVTDEPPTSYILNLKSTDSTTPYGDYEFSIDPSSTKYITNVFGNDATAGDPNKYVVGSKLEASYIYKAFEDAMAAVFADKNHYCISASALPNSGAGFLGEPMEFKDNYSLDLTNGDSQFSLTHATTPWIFSQKVANYGTNTSTRFRLFRLHTLSDGTVTNTSYKVEISNVKLAGTVAGTDWGTFTLIVRSYSDTDRKPIVYERYDNLTLDPESSNYIARRIGDRYNYIKYDGKIIEFGTFANNSSNIRVEMGENPWPITAVPYGFEAYATPINSSIGRWTPPMKYTRASLYGSSIGKYPSGVNFDDAPTGADAELSSLYPTSSAGIGSANDNKQYFAPLPVFGGYSSVGGNVEFALDNVYNDWGVGNGTLLAASLSGSVPAEYDATNEGTYVKLRKFILGFQGGFDGQTPAMPINVGGDIIPGNTQGLNCTNSTAAGSIAYKQCIGALSNADEFDINMIVTPGIVHQHHSYITNMVVDMCEGRGDVFYIMDLYVDDGNPTSGQIDEVVGYAGAYDTNYAASYYPWVKILDTNTNTIVTVPPSVVLPAVYAQNDRSAAEWFAPAGLNRGGIPQAVQVTDRTTHTERDTLYEGKVNPIAAFPGTGIAVWGQKTLQDSASALDRVSVRRLLINLKKYIGAVAKSITFEQNVSSTRNRFMSMVNPYLESVQQRSGLYAFFIKCDDENNSPDVVDKNILYLQIWLKPAKVSEFIVVDMTITPSGVTFSS
jgi:hypothetical protein